VPIKSVTITLHRNLKYMQLLLLTYLHFLEFFFVLEETVPQVIVTGVKCFIERKSIAILDVLLFLFP